MIFPIRCYTCSQVIADKWLAYIDAVGDELVLTNTQDKDETQKISKSLAFFKNENITRMCCRRHFLAHVELTDII